MKPRMTKKGKKPKKPGAKKRFVMDGGSDTPHTGGCIHNYDHVAQYYWIRMQSPDVAANLVRELRPWAQVVVVGQKVVYSK